jgi:hypothetical protein
MLSLASSSGARFGGADHLLTYSGADPRTQARVAAAGEWSGTIDVIGRREVPVPGSVESVQFRAQDPQGAYSAPMLALREDRYPTGADQVAVTDVVALTFQLDVGDPLALDGHPLDRGRRDGDLPTRALPYPGRPIGTAAVPPPPTATAHHPPMNAPEPWPPRRIPLRTAVQGCVLTPLCVGDGGSRLLENIVE